MTIPHDLGTLTPEERRELIRPPLKGRTAEQQNDTVQAWARMAANALRHAKQYTGGTIGGRRKS